MATLNQVIARTENHLNDVIPTQQMREDYVEGRLEFRKQPNILHRKLSVGKTNTP